jgi:PAS domain S-box-containing protein
LIDSGNDELVLSFATEQMVNASLFLLRVQYLYEHKHETSREEIVLKNGKIFDRYSSPVFGSDERYYGRIWYFRDITDSKNAAHELSIEKKQLKDIIDASPTSIWFKDTKNNFIRINNAAAKIAYRLIEEVEGHSTEEIFPAESVEYFKDDMEVITSGTSKLGIIERASADGKSKWLRTDKIPWYDNNGKIGGIIAFSLDITDRMEVEAKLLASESRYRRLFESAKDGILILDAASGQIVDVNPFLIEMLGYSHEEFIGLELWEIGVFKNIVASKEAFIELQNKGYIRYDDLPLETKGGKRINVEFVSNVYLVDKIKVIQCNIRDISERKIAYEKIKTLNEAIEQNQVTIIITNPVGSIEYVNPMFSEVTGYSSDEVIGKNLRFLQSGDKSKQEFELLWKTILSGKVWKGQFHNKKKNGDLYWEDSIISPILSDDGTITHFVAVKEDITEMKKMIDDLIIAKDKAEEMSRLKTSFLNNMSHELRTPLIGILGFSEILISEIKDKDHKEMVNQIHEGGVRLSQTLNLILDLSKIESEKISLEIKLYNLSEVTKRRIANYIGVAKLKGISLNTIINKENIFVNTDERIFSQILDNLVNNAIKFTDVGGVSVILDTKITSLNGKTENQAILKVIDTGIGIAEENYDLIFEEFRQVSEGLGRSFEGSGLGLSITKKFVLKLGGSISVESKVGVGSTFTVSLPIANTPEDYSKEKIIGQSSVVKEINDLPMVLLVDDDLPTYNISKIFLKNICTLEHACTGSESIAKVKMNQYQIILMDINLGFGMNGLTALKDIRKVSGYEKIPVVAFTAYATINDKQYFLSAGCDYYLSKPFQKADLQNLISEILSKSLKMYP